MQRTGDYRDYVPNRYRGFVPDPMPQTRPGDLVIGNAATPTRVIGSDGIARNRPQR